MYLHTHPPPPTLPQSTHFTLNNLVTITNILEKNMMSGSNTMQKSNTSRMLKLSVSILSIVFAMMILWSNGDSNDNDNDSTTITLQRQLSSLQQFMDPKSTNLRTGLQSEDEQQAKKLLEEQVMQRQVNLIKEADRAISQGNVAFRVHAPGEEDGALFIPSELLIEVVNPNPHNQYSVTVTSFNKYTGTAMLFRDHWTPAREGYQSAIAEDSLVYYWKPIFPGQYDILVHEIDRQKKNLTPKIEPGIYPIIVNEGVQAEGVGMSMIQDRIENMPPCQSQTSVNAFSHWDGKSCNVMMRYVYIPKCDVLL